MKFKTINPSTEEVLAEYEIAGKKEVDSAVFKAKKAFQEWKNEKLGERARLLKEIANVLRKNKEKYAEVAALEMGKPIKQAIAEVEKCAWTCEYYSENAEKFLQEETVQTDAKKSYVTFEPLGVVGSIMPWNFPYWQVFRFCVPALTVGNTILLKHSSVVPQCSLKIEEAFRKAGFPENVFQAVIGDGTTGDLLLQSNIDAVSLTGSVNVGSHVAEVAGRNLKKFVLELGGSDPFIVLEDAELEFACKQAVQGRTINSGQSCIAAKRFIVEEKVAEEFTEKFVEFTKALKVGNPLQKETDIGPLATESQLKTAVEQVKDAEERGGRILAGGKRQERKGYFFEPTVISNTNKSMKVIKEETFAPIAPIIEVKNAEEAIRVANDSEFGLAGSIWSKDRSKAEELAKGLEVGILFINGTVKSDPRMPFGGVKKSGIGRELSRYGLLEFTNIKSVMIY